MKYKSITTGDGTIMHTFEGKLHSWDGPALIPQGKNSLGEYYIYGLKKTKEEFLQAKKDWKGVPPSNDPNYSNSRSAG